MPILGIVGDRGSNDPQKQPNGEYEHYYTLFANILRGKGRETIRVYNGLFDIEKKTFRGGWQNGKHISDPTIDIILYRYNSLSFWRETIAQRYKTINTNALVVLTNDKLTSYKLFKDYFPETKTFYGIQKDTKKIDTMYTDKLVVKPRYGTYGNGVKLTSKKNIEKEIDCYVKGGYDIYHPMGNMLVQEFIDSSKGIEKVVDGIHDIRAMILGDQIIYYTIRTPQTGEFRCNLRQGGSSWNILPTAMPKSINETVKNIAERMNLITDCRRGNYSIDFCIDNQNRFRLIEFNANPGYGHLDNDHIFQELYVTHLLHLCYDFYQQTNHKLIH